MKKLLILSLMIVVILTSCNQKDKVNANLTQEADNFNITRQVTIINCITGDTIFQMKGRLSIEADREDNQLEIICEYDKNKYRKHFVGLSDNTTYLVEDLGDNKVDKYKYEINFNPKMWLPYKVKNVD